MSIETSRRALICGVSGQDGAYLAQFLLSKGYEVYGTSRDALINSFYGLKALGIDSKIQLRSMSPDDFDSVLEVFSEVNPHEIYNLSGQSSVGLSFEKPLETISSIITGTLNQLEAIRTLDKNIRFYNAGSSEVFGDTLGTCADENTCFKPQSPYAVAKAAATWEVTLYREAYKLFACTGILFNHESPLRPEHFVTKKIVTAAMRIADGSDEKLTLGNTAIRRDWGWSPDYVRAMWMTLNHENADDYIVSTGKSLSLQNFVEAVFEEADLDWRDHVIIDPSLLRPSDPMEIIGNPKRARTALNWEPSVTGLDVPRKMFRETVAIT